MEVTVIKPSVVLLTPEVHIKTYPRRIEACGRTCYKSEATITDESAGEFIKKLIHNGHLSVLEHCSITVKLIGDRSMSHQLVRHRIAAYSQESQRYCNYGKKGFKVICPPKIEGEWKKTWLGAIEIACQTYCLLLDRGVPPEDARSVLPNAMKTEVVTTFNLRQWRHVFEHRALNPKAQWQIRLLTGLCLKHFADLLPSVFADQDCRFSDLASSTP